jgi:hypothetical protein
MTRTAMELIGRVCTWTSSQAWVVTLTPLHSFQTGLGYSFDPLTTQTDNHYAEAIKALMFVLYSKLFFRLCIYPVNAQSPVLAKSASLRRFVPYITAIRAPALFKQLLPYVPIKRVQRLRHVSDALDAASRSVYDAKKAALERGDEAVAQQIGRGKDIMSILVSRSARNAVGVQ